MTVNTLYVAKGFPRWAAAHFSKCKKKNTSSGTPYAPGLSVRRLTSIISTRLPITAICSSLVSRLLRCTSAQPNTVAPLQFPLYTCFGYYLHTKWKHYTYKDASKRHKRGEFATRCSLCSDLLLLRWADKESE